MYQLPLKFIKVSDDVAICATRIVAIMSTKAYQARETVKNEKRAGTLINAAGRGACKSAIFLDNGSVIASSYEVNTLLKLIGKANKRAPEKATNETARMRIYDTILEPGEDCQEAEPDIDSIMDEIEEETKEDNNENYTSDSEDADE